MIEGSPLAQALLALVQMDRDRIAALGRAAPSALALHTALQRRPITTAAALAQDTGLSAATVNKALVLLMQQGIVTELTERRRGRVFSYRVYVQGLEAGLDDDPPPTAPSVRRRARRPTTAR